MKKYLVLALFVANLGCATSVRMMSDKRESINKSEVQVLEQRDNSAKTMATIETKVKYKLSEQLAKDIAINRFKRKAAKIGANAILINETYHDEESGWSNNGNMMTYNTNKVLTVIGTAVYIKKE